MATDYITLDNPTQSAPIANKSITFGVSRDSFVDYFPHETITKVEVTMSNQTGHKDFPNWLDAPYSLHEVRIEACGNNLTTSREGQVKVTTFVSTDPNKVSRVHTYNVIQTGGTDIVPPFPRVEFSLNKPYGDPGKSIEGEITTNLPYYKKNSLEVNRSTYIVGKITASAESGVTISVDTDKADYYNDTWHIPMTVTLSGAAPTKNNKGLKVYITDSKELAITVSVDNTTNAAHKVRSTRKGWVTVMGKNRRNGNHNVGTVLTHFEDLGSGWVEVKNDEYGHYKPSQGEGGSDVPQNKLVTSITLTGADSVQVGEFIVLSTNILPEDATSKEVTWKSSNPSVATVQGCKVTGVSVGQSVITATAVDGSNVSGSKTIQVTAAPVVEPETNYIGYALGDDGYKLVYLFGSTDKAIDNSTGWGPGNNTVNVILGANGEPYNLWVLTKHEGSVTMVQTLGKTSLYYLCDYEGFKVWVLADALESEDNQATFKLIFE